MTNLNDTKARGLLAAMTLCGIGVLVIPWLLTPPAYLDLALRDSVFGADLGTQRVTVTDERSGKMISTPILRVGNAFVARIGRINSGTSAYTARVTGYKPRVARVQAAALQRVRVPIDLTPSYGRLELSTVDATRADDPVTATVKNGTRAVTQAPQRVFVLDLPPGRHRLSAEAPGFCQATREFDVREGKVTKASMPLSPDLKDDEIARFVLGWRQEPNDLDTHLWKADVPAFPHPAKVYFKNKTGRAGSGATFARLDVDKLYPGGYETLTVQRNADGEFRYFIHVYSGRGTIADAGASVQVYTRGCQARTIRPPSDCTHRIWNVATLKNGPAGMVVADLQRCEPEGLVVVNKAGM